MSPALTRRRALLGSAAAAIGIGVPAVTSPSVKAAPAASPEAAALQAELARLSGEYRAAWREAGEAGGRVDYPDPPEALYVRPGDRSRFFPLQPGPSWSDRAEGRDWWALAETVEQLRGATFRYLNGSHDVQTVARRDEIVAASDRWQAEDKAAEDAAGYTAAQDRFDAASLAYREFRARLVELRSNDLEVLIAKALAVVDLCDRDADRLDTLIARALERDSGAYEIAMALSMARDFIALFGRSAWVSA